jgi:hypothetical protein
LDALARNPQFTLEDVAKVLKLKGKNPENAVKGRLFSMRQAYEAARRDVTYYERIKVQLGGKGERLL